MWQRNPTCGGCPWLFGVGRAWINSKCMHWEHLVCYLVCQALCWAKDIEINQTHCVASPDSFFVCCWRATHGRALSWCVTRVTVEESSWEHPCRYREGTILLGAQEKSDKGGKEGRSPSLHVSHLHLSQPNGFTLYSISSESRILSRWESAILSPWPILWRKMGFESIMCSPTEMECFGLIWGY